MSETSLAGVRDHRHQSPDVAERFRKLKARPVMLEAKGLTCVFSAKGKDVVALQNLNFRIHRREFTAVIGRSGCGKSTLARVIAGLQRPSRGAVEVDGKEVREPGPDRGMVFQSYTLFPWLTVKQNVMFGLRMAGHSVTRAESEALQWIELIGLAPFAEAYPAQLSGGMKQRVAIARALANQPRVLLMDEPFGALDAQTRARMQAYLMQIWRNVDVTIFFVTHDLDEAIYLADRILVLKPAPGEIQEIIEVPVPRPRHPDQFAGPEFLATKRRLNDLIHPPSEATDDLLPLLRLTRAGDDVE